MPEDNTDPLLQAVRDLLDALDPSDRDVAEDKLGSRAQLEHAMVDCARKVLARADEAGERPPPSEYRRVAAATLTLSHRGVATNSGHALDKYRRYLRHSALSPEVLVSVGRFNEDLVPLLAATVRIRDLVVSTTGRREPEHFLTAVAAACAHGFGLDRDCASDAEVADAVIAVLNRGAVLARDYRRSGRPRAGQHLSTAAAGNADFLEQAAAWHVAIAERIVITERRSHDRPADPLDAVEKAIRVLEKRLHDVATRPVNRSWADEEPDVVLVFGEVAGFIGAATGDGAVVTRKVVDRLSPALRRLRTRRQPKTESVDFMDPETVRRTGHHRTSHEDEVVFVYHLMAWTIAMFFDGVEVADRETLLTWLAGDRPVESQDDLLFLVCCLRVTLHRLDQLPDQPPAQPGLAKPDIQRLAQSLLQGLTHAVADLGLDHPARVVAAALPPLWTHRRPAVHLVTSHLQTLNPPTHRGRAKAELVAAAGVYGPSQRLHRAKGGLPRQCCWNHPDGANCAQPDVEPLRCCTPGEPHPATDPCRERPWSEVGIVENYTTLATWARFSSHDNARKHLARYKSENNPGSEMLTGNWSAER